MSTDDLSVSGRNVSVAGRRWSAEYDIADGRVMDGRVVLLYDSMAGPRQRQFRNLEAFDFDGRKLWTAEHPTSEAADAYTAFVTEHPLTVSNFAGYLCELDTATGKLVREIFTK